MKQAALRILLWQVNMLIKISTYKMSKAMIDKTVAAVRAANCSPWICSDPPSRAGFLEPKTTIVLGTCYGYAHAVRARIILDRKILAHRPYMSTDEVADFVSLMKRACCKTYSNVEIK